MANEVEFSFEAFPPFARALKEAAPRYLLRETGKALYKMGRADIERMKTVGLSGLNIRAKKFRNSFKSFSTDARKVKRIDQLVLSEYTGAEPFRIFQVGGTIAPFQSRLMTILTPDARNGSGARKISQAELRAMITSGQAKIIQTRAGPAVIKIDERLTKAGNLRKGSKATILAWLKPKVREKKRIDFYANFDANAAIHESLLGQAAENAIASTIASKGE